MRPERPGSYNVSLSALAWREVGTLSSSDFSRVLNVLHRLAASAARSGAHVRGEPLEGRVVVGELEARFRIDHAHRVLFVEGIAPAIVSASDAASFRAPRG